MSEKITKHNSVYGGIISFLQTKYIHKGDIKELKFNDSNNLVVVLKNNKKITYTEYPKKMLKTFQKEKEELEAKDVLLAPTKTVFKDNQEEIADFMMKHFKISDNIYFTVKIDENSFLLIFYFNNERFSQNISYKSLLKYKKIFFEHELRLYMNFNVLKEILLDIIKNYKPFKTESYFNLLKKTYIQKLYQCLEDNLKKRYRNLEVKDNYIQIFTGGVYKKTEITFNSLFSDKECFELKSVKLNNILLPLEIHIKREALVNAVDNIFKKISLGKLKLDKTEPILFTNWLNQFLSRNNETYTGILNDRMTKCKTIIAGENGYVYIKTDNNYISASESDNELNIEYRKDKEKFLFIFSDKYTEISKFLDNYFKDTVLTIGEGLLFGTSKIWIKETEIELQNVPILKSEKDWKLGIQSDIKLLDKKITTARVEKYKALRKEESLIFGSQLARDILSIIEKHNNSIITEMLLDIIYRKKQIIKDVNQFVGFPDYSMIPNEHIEKVIQALIRQKYIEEYVTFTYKSLRINQNKVLFDGMTEQSMRDIENHITNHDYISPDERIYILDEAIKEQKQYPILLDAIDDLEFLCRSKDKYVSYTRSIPSYKALFTMKFDNGFYDDRTKEIKSIIKEIIK